MRDQQIPNIDLKEIQRKGQLYFEKMKKAYSKRDYQQLPEEELFTSSFPYVDSIEDSSRKDCVKVSKESET